MLILQPSSTTSRMFATWKSPGKIVEKRSPYSYVVQLNEARYRLHANELRRFRARVEDIRIDGCYFGDPYSIPDAELSSLVVDDYLDSSEIVEQQMSTSKIALCAIISDEDTDFGDIQTFDAGIRSQSDAVQLPSQRIDRDTLSHLSDAEQQQLLLVLLYKFPDAFCDEPGFYTGVEHSIPLDKDFRPKRMKAYNIPDKNQTRSLASSPIRA